MPIIETQGITVKPEPDQEVEVTLFSLSKSWTAQTPSEVGEILDFVWPDGPTVEEETEENPAYIVRWDMRPEHERKPGDDS